MPRAADTDTLFFDVSGIPAGTYLARVRVDGAESGLTVDASGTFNGPSIIL
jgi:hypothetical protein